MEDFARIVASLKSCAKQKNLHKGITIHADVHRRGLLRKYSYLGNAIVNMYAKCDALAQAQDVFDQLPIRNVVSWNGLIAGYCQNEHAEEALHCFTRMRHEGLSPNAMTFTSILKACGSIGQYESGREIHAEIAKTDLLSMDHVLGTALVDMYVKCGAVLTAQQIFDDLPTHSVISWTALIEGYVQHRFEKDALNVFEHMQKEGFTPDAMTLASMLKACSNIEAIEKGEEIHDYIAKHGLLEQDGVLGTAVVDMYAKCHVLTKAHKVFDKLPLRNVIIWSALITGYSQHCYGEEVLECYEQMQHEGLSPDALILACLLKACGNLGAVEKGKEVHEKIVREGLWQNNVVLANALVDMYAKCGMLVVAQQVFDELPVVDVLSWNGLIAGYCQHGNAKQALNCYEQMQCKGLSPDAMTLACILKACGEVGAADKGNEVHAEIIRKGFLENDIVLGTALVDMYVKYAALTKAKEVFDGLPVRGVATWNALITGYFFQGHGVEAMKCSELMQHEGICPDVVTFICILGTCSCSGFMDEAEVCFDAMIQSHNVIPSLEHYTCMVDLFSRCGYFDKAMTIISKIPCSDYVLMWFVLLCACKKWGNIELGRLAFEHAVVSNANTNANVNAMYIMLGAEKSSI